MHRLLGQPGGAAAPGLVVDQVVEAALVQQRLGRLGQHAVAAARQRQQRIVVVLVQGGTHEARWDGRDRHGEPVSSGIYLYRLQVGAAKLTGKMALVK